MACMFAWSLCLWLFPLEVPQKCTPLDHGPLILQDRNSEANFQWYQNTWWGEH
jgi:hypothetical protein